MRFLEELEYNSETGIFSWKRDRQGVKAGVAGSKMKNGYIIIRIDGKHYLAHRLAFLFMTGSFPKLNVDHKNNQRDDNRWSNLREATPSQNNCNRVRGDLPLGIYKRERKNRIGIWYETKIQKDRKKFSSFFRKLEDAVKWRNEKEKQLFGEFRCQNIQ